MNWLISGGNPVRFRHFRQVLFEILRIDVRGKTALDIECGGGLLAEKSAWGPSVIRLLSAHPNYLS